MRSIFGRIGFSFLSSPVSSHAAPSRTSSAYATATRKKKQEPVATLHVSDVRCAQAHSEMEVLASRNHSSIEKRFPYRLTTSAARSPRRATSPSTTPLSYARRARAPLPALRRGPASRARRAASSRDPSARARRAQVEARRRRPRRRSPRESESRSPSRTRRAGAYNVWSQPKPRSPSNVTLTSDGSHSCSCSTISCSIAVRRPASPDFLTVLHASGVARPCFVTSATNSVV